MQKMIIISERGKYPTMAPEIAPFWYRVQRKKHEQTYGRFEGLWVRNCEKPKRKKRPRKKSRY